jgi:hypothetical protein
MTVVVLPPSHTASTQPPSRPDKRAPSTGTEKRQLIVWVYSDRGRILVPVRIARVGKHRVRGGERSRRRALDLLICWGRGRALRGLGGEDLGWREGGGGYTEVWCVCEGAPSDSASACPSHPPLQGRRSLARGRWTRTREQGAQYYGRA